MSRTNKIYNWGLWQELCWQYNINPHKYVDFSIKAPRQITGGNTIDYEYLGEVPKEEGD